MARYFLHLRSDIDEVTDCEGSELVDLDALRHAVVDCARDLMAGDLKFEGVLDLRSRIDAEDAKGSLVFSLPFSRAVKIIS